MRLWETRALDNALRCGQASVAVGCRGERGLTVTLETGMQDAAYGFLLVTTDSVAFDGKRRTALDAARHRIARAAWPLYSRTACRSRIGVGTRVAIYVGGRTGQIIAIATVAGVTTSSTRRASNEPTASEAVSHVLALEHIQMLEPPVDFRSQLPFLEMRPRNLSKWGVILMGGVRGIGRADWSRLFNQSP